MFGKFTAFTLTLTIICIDFSYIIAEQTTFPSAHVLIVRKGYSLEYDHRTKNAIWVHECISSEDLENLVERKNGFKEDARISSIFRSTLKDFKSSGFDRGHLACCANHKNGLEDMEDTFFLSNISPQIPQFNRGYWQKVEKHIRSLIKNYKDIDIYTGPLYLPETDDKGLKWIKYQVIGENNIAVPTHFFKVVISQKNNNIMHEEAYILPNADIAQEIPLENFKTSVQKVERIAGIKFSP